MAEGTGRSVDPSRDIASDSPWPWPDINKQKTISESTVPKKLHINNKKYLKKNKSTDRITIPRDQWINTAQNDLMVAKWLFQLCAEKFNLSGFGSLQFDPTKCQLDSPPYNWICLISSDCIEKALKAALSLCNSLLQRDLSEHHINEYVERLIRRGYRQFQELSEEVKAAEDVCYRARWPNWHKFGTPGENFKVNDACKLLNLAHNILHRVKTIIRDIDYPPLPRHA